MALLQSKNMADEIPVVSSPAESCESCIVGKFKKGTSPKQSYSRASRAGELFHSDLCGPLDVTLFGHRYILTFTDDYSRYKVVYLLKSKAEFFSKFQEFDTRNYNQFARHISVLRSDNGTEYKNSNVDQYCKAYGIQQQYTTRYSSSQNGVAERLNLTIMDGVRALLLERDLPSTYWGEAAMNLVYSRNRSPTSANGLQTPFELFMGVKPTMGHLQIFGSVCFALTTPYQRRISGPFKLSDRSERCVFLGYSNDSKSYRLLSSSNKIILARYEDTLFPKSTASEIPTILATTLPDPQISSTPATPPSTPAPTPITAPILLHPTPATEYDTADDLASESDDSDFSTASPTRSIAPIMPSLISLPQPGKGYTYEPITNPAPNAIAAPPTLPKRSKPLVDYSSAFVAVSDTLDDTCLSISDSLHMSGIEWFKLPPAFARSAKGDELPLNYEGIAELADKKEWIKATDNEIASLIEHGTWELVPLPPGRKALKNKWVFRIKRDSNANVVRYKARLCACGYSQVSGIDYKDIYAPVVRAESFRLFLSIVAARNMECIQMDVVTAFLNGKIEEEVFMKQAPGYTDKSCPDHVCKIMKNLYGLKQAPRVWHKTIDPYLKSLGFKSLIADPCIYYKWDNGKLTFISLYVDDLAIASDDSDGINKTRNELLQKFKMTDDGELEFVIGMKIRRDRAKRKIFVSSEQKINAILQDYNMATCIPTSTPMDCVSVSTADCPSPNSEEWNEMQSVPYRQCVGRLTHLMLTTRPDLAFAVSVVNRYLHNPGRKHWNVVKRILRYLKGTASFELCLSSSNSSDPAIKLSGNTDADWAGHTDSAKSTSGYTFFVNNSLVSWASKAQSQTATSSTHAEYIAAYHATSECLWTRSFLGQLGLIDLSLPTTLSCDNEAAIKIASYHMVTPRSKHFDTKLHSVREKVENGELSFTFCPGKDNVADIFTKPLQKGKFIKFRDALGLLDSSERVEVL
jgi:hypothetical protein